MPDRSRLVDSHNTSAAARRWKWVVRLCQIALVGLIAFAVWSVGFRSDSGANPVLPETDAQFSLDLEVVGALDHPLVYAVEQRARPSYRILAFDPTTGEDTTVFTVPDDAIIYGIALNNNASQLALTYTPDYRRQGSGVWLFDLESAELTQVVDVNTDVYFTDPAWLDDETVLMTRVDRRGDDELLATAQVSVETGTVAVLAERAINPVASNGEVYTLQVGDNGARRSIGLIEAGSETTIASSDLDLDHLVSGNDGTLYVAAIDTDDSTTGITFGDVAAAHGNHDQPSTWWTVPLTQQSNAELRASDVEPLIVYDASFGNNAIVYATNEGLSIADIDSGDRADLIKSRAIRLVAS